MYLNITTFALGTSIKILNGQDAEQGQFPYQVYWCYDDSDGNNGCINHCGASIFNDKTIITAAHCCLAVKSRWQSWKIVAGELDMTVDSGLEQSKRITNYLIHPDFNPQTLNNDICLLTLDSPLEWNKNVQRIPLSTQLDLTSPCLGSGWGSNKDGEPSEVLQWIEVNLTDCEGSFDNQTMICASDAPHSCEGDDGGPLACDGKLTGIVSRVCGDPQNEGVYTRVEHFSDWIEANAQPDDHETTTEQGSTEPLTTHSRGPLGSETSLVLIFLQLVFCFVKN